MNIKCALHKGPLAAVLTKAFRIPSFHFSATCFPRGPQYIHLLQPCKDLQTLLRIHGLLIVSGLSQDHFSGTHLIKSYSFFRKFGMARTVLDSTPNPPVILWNSMIRAYSRSTQFEKALEMYRFMLGKGLEPDKHTFTFVLKACTGALDFQEGISVHEEIARRELEYDIFIGAALVGMYCRMGDLWSAVHLFDKMPVKDVACWNTMIAGFSKSSDPCRALEMFRDMQLRGVEPDSVSLLNLVPAVSTLADIDSCRSIHGYTVRRYKDVTKAISNALIDMYCKCKEVNVANRVFNNMFVKDDISWGTIMAGMAHNKCFSEVLELFNELKRENLMMNKVSIVSALLAAAEMRDLEKGKEMHSYAVQLGINSDAVVVTPIMTMYAKCGDIRKAKELFHGLQDRDLVAWSALLSAFIQSGYPEDALTMFREMQRADLKPDEVTLTAVLSACAEISSERLSKSIHCYILKANMESDISVATTIVSVYFKCGSFSLAMTLFNTMLDKDVVTWNAIINGHSTYGIPSYALELFRQLLLAGVQPDIGSFIGLVSAVTQLKELYLGNCIHGQIIKIGFESDFHASISLMDMYAKCGSVSSAEMLFNITTPMNSEVPWNVMISGYLHNRNAKQAIFTFHRMKLESIWPNSVTFVSLLPAVASLADLKEGLAIHACIIQMGFMSNILVGNSLIDMYAKCGHLNYSEKCFNEMKSKDTVSWNIMLSSYALNGQGSHAVAFFSSLLESGIQFDSMSFINVLSACRHAGLVQEGREIFRFMCDNYHIKPHMEHFACMVDLLGRAGLFDEILCFIRDMPMKPDAEVWGALLGACEMHSNVKLGEIALDHIVKLEPGNPAHHIVLSNIYSQYGRWSDSQKARSKIYDHWLKLTPGCSWIGAQKVEH